MDSSQLLLFCSFSSNSLWRWMPPWMPCIKAILNALKEAFNKAQLFNGIFYKLCLCWGCIMQDVWGQRLNISRGQLPEFVLTRVFFKPLDPGVVDAIYDHCSTLCFFPVSRLKIKWKKKKNSMVLKCLAVAALGNWISVSLTFWMNLLRGCLVQVITAPQHRRAVMGKLCEISSTYTRSLLRNSVPILIHPWWIYPPSPHQGFSAKRIKMKEQDHWDAPFLFSNQSNRTKQENKLDQKRLIISSLINIVPLFA